MQNWCPEWLFGRVMLRHNQDRKTVAIPQPRDNPPMGGKHNMQDSCPNCPKWFGVVPSVSDGMARTPLAERERYTYDILHTCVQNELERCPKLGKATDTTDKTDRGEIHDTHKPHKTYRPHKSHEKVCRQCVQNGGKRCPKWFGVVPSVSDGGSKLLSRSESATTELFCTGVSRLSRMLFENLIKLETRCAQRLSNVSGMIRR